MRLPFLGYEKINVVKLKFIYVHGFGIIEYMLFLQ